jgi:DNA-binding Xre family transcriptional regulator
MMNQIEQQVSISQSGNLIAAGGRDTFSRIMIRLVVKEVAEKEGITNAKELSTRTGLHYESCRLLWYGKTRRIDIDTVEKLCDALHVRPGQLFEYEYEPDKRSQQKQPSSKAATRRKSKMQ